jgi:hypothetical protein
MLCRPAGEIVNPQDHWRQQAHRLLEMAQKCPQPDMAGAMRMLAAEYLDLAQNAVASTAIVQQQSQTQPDGK